MNPVEIKDLPGLVGQEVGVSDWLQITQDRVNMFAEATGDFQWIHVDDVKQATKESHKAIQSHMGTPSCLLVRCCTKKS